MTAHAFDRACLPQVRARIAEAEDILRDACELLRRRGGPEMADDLQRALRLVQTWTAPDGYLAAVERPLNAARAADLGRREVGRE